MPVNAHHPQYVQHVSQWRRCRDAVDGSDAIKARGQEYLPKLGGQTDQEYEAYKMRALWYGASARTVQGLTGAVMRKDPATEVPKALEPHLQDVTLTGVSFVAFAKTTLEEVLKTGRYGVLVDMPAQESDTAQPYYAAYRAESIINWKTLTRDGIQFLQWVVLCESVWEQAKLDDLYALHAVEQYRVLRLNAAGQYEVETYREDPQHKGQYISKGIVIPNFRGAPLDYIPFCFFGPNTITADIEKPPILDLVDVNLSHYRSSADLEHGAHFCGLPTPWVAGFPESTQLKIGSAVAWVSSDPNASAGMLEFTGQGLNALEVRLDKKEKLMAVLGARLLEEPRKAVEASDTVSMRLSGEQSVLRSVAGTVSTGLSKLLEWAARWKGVSPDDALQCTAQLNKDFLDTAMTFAELEALVRSWQAGAMSYETMYYNMERGELTRPGTDWKTEKEQIEAELPELLPQNEPPAPDAGGV